jgi:hypothetical protein
MKSSKLLVLWVLGVACASASVVETVNVTNQALKFTGPVAAGVDSVDALVPALGVRKWMVPDSQGGITYAVDAIVGATVTNLGTLTVYAEKAYAVHYDGAAGLVVTERTYDASYLGSGGYTKTEMVSWVRYGMLSQFAVEIAALCFIALRVTRKGAISHLSGGD